jgi:hypothetical protein
VVLTSALVGLFSSTPITLYPLHWRLSDPQSRSGRRGEETILDPTGTRIPTLDRPTSSHMQYRLRYAPDHYIGGAIAQAVRRRLPNMAARVRAQVRSCGICGAQSGTGTGFLRVLRFPLSLIVHHKGLLQWVTYRVDSASRLHHKELKETNHYITRLTILGRSTNE